MEGFTNPSIEKLALDVTSDDAVEHVVQTILEKEGKIDIAVNNAGILAIGKYATSLRGRSSHTINHRPSHRHLVRASQAHI